MKTALIFGAGLVGFGGPVTLVSYYRDKVTIWDILKDEVIPVNLQEEDVWETIKGKLPNEPNLKTITSQSQTKELKSWCFSAYSKTYKDWFKDKNDTLLSDVKKVCKLSIKDKLSQTNIFDTSTDQDKATLTINTTILKNYSEEEKKTLPLIDGLESIHIEIKTKSNEQDDWQKLRSWCKDIYEKGYQGKDTNRWLLVNKFCKKGAAQ